MTPCPYFSWSSYNLFGHSPERWRKRYLLGEEGFQTPEMLFGKEMAKKRERGDDEGIEHIAMFLPKYPKREYEMTCEVDMYGRKIVLLGIPDGVDLRRNIVADDKTGKKWTQAMADKAEQLTWYAFIYWKKKGVIPKLHLNWIETEWVANPYSMYNVIRATGKVQTFETTRTHKDFVILLNKINNRWRGILTTCSKEWERVL